MALFSLCSQCVCQADPTDPGDWTRAAETAADLAEPTDGIRIHPPWSEAPMADLREVGNLVHRHHTPLLEDFVGIQRVLIITQSDRHDQALDRLPFDPPNYEVHEFDTVALLEVPVPDHSRIDATATDRLEEATVSYVDAEGAETPCRRITGETTRFGCEDGEVGSELLEVEDDPRRCIRSDPPSGDRHLAVEIPVDLEGDVLRVRAGLDRRAARLERGRDVVYRVFADDEQIADRRVDGHTSEWTAHDIPIDRLDGPSTDVRLEVESVVPSPHHRRFCFNAWTLTDEQADSQ